MPPSHLMVTVVVVTVKVKSVGLVAQTVGTSTFVRTSFAISSPDFQLQLVVKQHSAITLTI